MPEWKRRSSSAPDTPERPAKWGLLWLTWTVTVAVSYAAAASFGLWVPHGGTHLSLIWLPTGIAVAAMWRLGIGMAPAVFIGAIAANATVGMPMWLAVAMALGNTAGPALSACLLKQWAFNHRLLRRRDMSIFVAALLVGTAVTASNGCLWLVAGDKVQATQVPSAWLTWWMGDLLGALLSGVPLVALNPRALRRGLRTPAGLHDMGLQLVVLLCGLAVFSPWLPTTSALLFPFLALPFVLIAPLALRGGVFAASLAVLLLGLAAASGTAHGVGPFGGIATRDIPTAAWIAWCYITAQVVANLFVCSVASELQSSKRQYAALMRGTQDGILVINEAGQMRMVNPAAIQMLSLQIPGSDTDEHLTGRILTTLPHGNGWVLTNWLHDPATSASGHLVLRRADGSTLPVACQATPYLDANGNSKTQLVLRDLTGQKRDEALLATSQTRLKTIADNLPAFIAYVDRDEVFRFANAQFRAVRGAEPDNLVGQTLVQFLGPEAYAKVKPEMDEALRGVRGRFDHTGWARISDIHFQADYIPHIHSDGTVAGCFIMVLDISDRRRAELALARSEQQIRTITDNLPALISHVDRELRYTFANAKVGELLGCSAASLIGKTLHEVYTEETFGNAAPTLTRALSGEMMSFETSGVFDGQQTYFDTNCVPEYSSAGEVVGLYVLTFEVTQRRQAEEKLRKSQQLLERTGAIAGVGGWALDLVGNVLHWTTETRRIHEVRDDFVPTIDNAFDFYPESARRILVEALKATLEHGSAWDLELPLLTAQGRSIWVRATGEVALDEGRPVRVFGALQDVTERMARETKLREQTELLQITLNSMGDGVITTNALGCVDWMNPVAERMTGMSRQDALGRRLLEVFPVVHADTRQLVFDITADSLAEIGRTNGTKRHVLIARDGPEYAIENTASPIQDVGGRIRGAVLVFHDVSEQRHLNDQMAYRATHDELTGLVNRTDFEARLGQSLSKTHRDGTLSALMFIDLDQFKLVNDACGHAVGDKMLRQASALMVECVRDSDTLARLGGDEFGAVLEHCTAEQAQRVAQTICDRMDQFRFEHEGRRFRIGASIGLIQIDAGWPTPEALLHAADTACYAAKAAGRNRVHVWIDADQTLTARASEVSWGSRLESALDDGGFVLYAQQICPIHADSGRLHFEVLLRLVEPDGSIVPPGLFLPAAERFYIASRIDRWVIRAVFEWLAAEGGAPDDIDTIAINLSGQSIGDRAFHRYVEQLLEEIPIDVSKLCFEVTETAAITHLADATAFITAIRALGMRVALDDFGAGASSFGYLKNMPVDFLKIDGQFVKHVEHDPLDKVAVRCFHDVALAIGVQTIAEFVETEGVLATLREIGVNYAQGYFFHKPEPLASFLKAARQKAGTVV